ncbi:MAG TPA: phosphoglucosamine mutase [Pyrinomonadaceae bacterium]|nr:phosphoglucosamine mutase [Pyrinomonadaceae bacterium]
MKPLKIGITGVRGIVGESFTPELVVEFAQAFGTYMDAGRILVCRDTRPSGLMVQAGVNAGLLAAGCEVIDLGICTTPSMQLAITELGAVGGIAITAGHNPEQWNALKFVRGDGLYLNATQGEELLDIYHQGEFLKTGWEKIRTNIESVDPTPHHLKTLAAAFDVEAIKAKHLTVAVDCCNGACARLIPRWLELLGCEVLALNDDPSAPFPHSPEPKPETMAQLGAVVKAGRADIGFAHDADGERLGIVTEQGEPLSEELTLALAAETRLQRRVGPIVTNVSTSSAVDQIASRYGASVVRTPVGQAYVSEAIVEHQAVLGGEGSGGIAVPEVHPTHDSAAAIGLILERLARDSEVVSDFVSQLPRLTMIKHNIQIEPNRLYSMLQSFRLIVEREQLVYDLTDGIKVTLPDGWVHARVSNTESMIRLIVEATEGSRARQLLDWARDRLRK